MEQDINVLEINSISTTNEEYVYVTKTGSVYHKSKDCPALKARNPKTEKISLSEAKTKGYKPCKRCNRG